MTGKLSLQELIHSIADERGLDLRGYKPSTLERRLRRRMFQVGIGEYTAYLEYVRSHTDEINQLLTTVLINVTEFFRDPQAWEAVRREVLPELLGDIKPGDTFRAWSAGCASGEEPFSLAMLIADYFGPHLPEYDIKIYANDVDEDALNLARRGEYPADRLRRVRPEWRERYFTGPTTMRINREVRRMVIFGRSNLVSDAPISHCRLVICRNVLIYFDTATQRQILARLHYALEPGGFLFLGKAESKLSESHIFRPVNSRWRIFQKADTTAKEPPAPAGTMQLMAAPDEESRIEQDLRKLRLQYQHLLETLKSGVIVLDANDIITAANDAVLAIWGVRGANLTGKRIQNTELVLSCPELSARLEAARSSMETVSFQCRLRLNHEERTLAVMIRPILTESDHERLATVIHTEDITSHERLQVTVEQLEATSEELQSANEELETTNEELQSTNEELETTNEELQSTNEELETTNEELQSLNEELENMNEELEARSRELNALTGRYAETLTHMPWPVMLVDRKKKIQLWNAAAQRLFGVGATSVVGVALEQLPIERDLRSAIVRRCRAVLEKGKTGSMRHQHSRSSSFPETFDIRFIPITREEANMDGVLVMFGPVRPPARLASAKQETLPAKAKGKSASSHNPGRSARKPKRKR